MLVLDTVSSTYMSVVEISMSGMIGALPVGDRLHAPALAEGLIAEIDRHVVVKEGGGRGLMTLTGLDRLIVATWIF